LYYRHALEERIDGAPELIADQIRGGTLVVGGLGSIINFIDAGTLFKKNDNLLVKEIITRQAVRKSSGAFF
jgi:hypothetical protein